MDHGKPIINLDIFIKDAFHLLLDNQLTLAGVYPTNNEFFTKDTITTDLRFLIGQFKIFINKKQLERRSYELLEDYENSLKHYCHGGGVLRFNYITLKANYNSGKGGLKEYRTIERKLYEVKKFVEEYPQYSRSKKDGFEIQFNKNPKRDIIKSLWIGNFLNAPVSRLRRASISGACRTSARRDPPGVTRGRIGRLARAHLCATSALR